MLVEDLGSANGTFVNFVRADSAFLKCGDLIQIGGVEVQFDLEYAGEFDGRDHRGHSSGEGGGAPSARVTLRIPFGRKGKTGESN